MSELKQVQTITGKVEKICSEKTVRVATKITKIHPLYRKRYSQVKHYIAHDPSEGAVVNSIVTIEACRPISKNKHWIIKS